MHTFCFCHKLALIVNAGLAALGVKAPPPLKVKENDRGRFPMIETIAKEEEPTEDEPTIVPPGVTRKGLEDEEELIEHDEQDLEDLPTPEVLLELDDEGEWDNADAEDDMSPDTTLEDDEVQPTHRREANHIDYILRKVSNIYWSPCLFFM